MRLTKTPSSTAPLPPRHSTNPSSLHPPVQQPNPTATPRPSSFPLEFSSFQLLLPSTPLPTASLSLSSQHLLLHHQNQKHPRRPSRSTILLSPLEQLGSLSLSSPLTPGRSTLSRFFQRMERGSRYSRLGRREPRRLREG
ncbi:hypothetical protein BDY24DRAFT_136813 [Mrakia frigida]|uniref:uncharacterized protein n=1 Tax=Mrakia frigida TaxID=29902 RepID=UPI003FCC0133